MGGFRFNGCGATDHFKKVKSLGIQLCPQCQKAAEFFLEEVKFKVDIFFIPTVTLKSRYAVMCSKCKQGEFCSDQWAVNLINGTGPASVIFESQVQTDAQAAIPEQAAPPVSERTMPQPTVQPERTVQQPAPQPQPEAVARASAEQAPRQSAYSGSTEPSFFKCPHCGVTQLREGAFCSFCGKPAPGEPTAMSGPAQVESDKINVCPVCGNKEKLGMKFCSNCGSPMEAQLQSERVCPGCGTKIEGTAAFCMECGMKL